eukprot:337424-Prymnesium_polylepis.1
MLLHVISGFGWKNVGMLYTSDAYGSTFAHDMRGNSEEFGVAVTALASFTSNTSSTYAPACERLKASGVNVVVLVSYSQDVAQIMKLCKALGIWGQGSAWITSGAASASDSVLGGAAFGQTPDETIALLSGMLQLASSPEGSSGYTRFQNSWTTQNASVCENPFFNASDDPLFTTAPWNVAAFAYDCVVALAIAVSHAVDPTDGAQVAARFREVEFDGATGMVRFGANGDRDVHSISFALDNWVAAGATIDVIHAADVALERPVNGSASITWHESAFAPIDLTTLP